MTGYVEVENPDDVLGPGAVSPNFIASSSPNPNGPGVSKLYIKVMEIYT